ncbi:MAG: hypothetical protein V4616_09370, partial [Bacteroidota bacterium]
MRNYLAAFAILLITLTGFSQQQRITCIPGGSNWKVYKGSSTPSKTFTIVRFEDLPTYNEDDWTSLKAPLGYKEDALATDLRNPIPGIESKTAVYLYNSSFLVQHYPTDIDSLVLRVRYNDGFVVWLNGIEVARRNLPAFPIPVTSTTTATTVHNIDEYELITISPFKLALINGNMAFAGENHLAVELHNAKDSDDLAFDLEAYYTRASSAIPLPIVVRKPYLQMAGPNSMTVRWRTNVPTTSEVKYGKSQLAQDLSYTDNIKTTESVDNSITKPIGSVDFVFVDDDADNEEWERTHESCSFCANF